MGLLDKAAIEEIKNAVVEAKADAVKESAAKTKVDRMRLFIEAGDRLHNVDYYTDEEYAEYIVSVLKLNGLDATVFKK